MAVKTYTVHRSMHADGRDYEPGDTRELAEIDAAELVASGALSLEGETPRVREPAVRHTFGARPSTAPVPISASGGEMTVAAEPVKPARASKA